MVEAIQEVPELIAVGVVLFVIGGVVAVVVGALR